jgi:hypothetical protein
MKTATIYMLSVFASFGTALASECTTSTPVTSQIVSDAAATIGSGGTYSAVGTATCPDQMGPQGPKGDTGAAGPQGIPGAKGDTGAAGANGEQGLQGIAGPTGAKGDTGATGAQGAQGIAGAAGVAGPQGATGHQGIAGAKGDKGDTGSQGVAGVAGPKGDKGDTGADGLTGATGAPGAVVNLDTYNANLAAVAALSIPHVSENKRFAFSGGVANAENSTGLSLNGAVRIDRTWQAGVGASFSVDGKATVVKGTFTGEW